MSARGHALSLVDIGHSFGRTRALADLSLDIAPGELVALLGPSGCGKTTLLQIIGGFIRPSTGEVRLDGARIEHVPANRRRIGMVFQSYALFPHMTVFENVAYGLRARGRRGAEVRAKVEEMLSLVQMSPLAQRYPRQLYGGQQQRVALARALAIEPGVVLLDEPFSALDKSLRLDMQIEIKSLLKGYGVTSILVTHDQEEALSMADRVAVLNRGRIEQIGAPDAIYDAPASLFVNTFIGHANLLGGVVTGPGRLRLDAGPELALARPLALPTGARAIASVRPETFALASPQDDDTVAARLALVMPLGAVTLLDAVLPSGEAVKVSVARGAGPAHPPPGATIHLRIAAPSRVGVFAPPPSVSAPAQDAAA